MNLQDFQLSHLMIQFGNCVRFYLKCSIGEPLYCYVGGHREFKILNFILLSFCLLITESEHVEGSLRDVRLSWCSNI